MDVSVFLNQELALNWVFFFLSLTLFAESLRLEDQAPLAHKWISLQVLQYAAGEYKIQDEESYASNYLAEFCFKFHGYVSFSFLNKIRT